MKKKRLLIFFIILILLILLIPQNKISKDNIKVYKSLSYKVIKYNNYIDDENILNGYVIKFFGFEIYSDLTIKEFEDQTKVSLGFVWNPHVYSGYLKKWKSKEYEKKYITFVDSIISGKEKVECKDREMAFDLMMTLKDNFPPFTKVVYNYEYEDGYMLFEYNGSDIERKNVIENFGKKVEDIINNSVMKSDNDTMAAISLYHYYASRITYDYDAAADDSYIGDLSAYRGIMDYSGICQTFGPAYAYLLNCLGIDAIEAGGLNVDPNVDPHSWTLLKLDGQEYFADVTFESSTNGQGLKYFGMDRKRREFDGYLQKNTVLGFNLQKANNLNIENSRFDKLSACDDVIEIKRSNKKMEIVCLTPKGEADALIINK